MPDINLVCLNTHVSTFYFIKFLNFELCVHFTGGVNSICMVFVLQQLAITRLYCTLLWYVLMLDP